VKPISHERGFLITLTLALVLVGFLAYSGNHKANRVCELALPATDIVAAAPLDENGHPIADNDINAQYAHLKHQAQEHTTDGELYRWQKFEGEELANICNFHPIESP
jgi:hypothetical protein